MAKKISIDQLTLEVSQIIKEYTEDVETGIEKEVEDTAKKVQKDAQANAREKTGKYKKGISRKKERNKSNEINYIIYNKNKPGLAHLLEFGHAKVNGGRVKAFPHLRPAYDKNVPAMEKRIEQIIKNGGR